MTSPRPVDSEGVIFFSGACDSNQQHQGVSADDDYQLVDFSDRQSSRPGSAFVRPAAEDTNAPAADAPRAASTNNSALNPEVGSGDNTVMQNVSEMFSGVTGVLNQVVSELRSLKESNVRASASMSTAFGRHDVPTYPKNPWSSDQRSYQSRPTYSGSRLFPTGNSYVDRCFAGQEQRTDEGHIDPWGQQLPYSSSQHHAYYRREKQLPGNLKVPPFTGKEDWAMWIARFEAIASRYAWGPEEKLDQLLPRLEGQAATFVFSQLRPALLNSYSDLVAEMNSRFRVIETARSFAAQFSRRVQRHGESVEDYAADLKRLYDKGHSFRDKKTRDEDLVRRFLDGLLDDDARFEVEYHKEPRNIDEAVFHVVNLIQTRNINEHDRRNRRSSRRVTQNLETADYQMQAINRVPAPMRPSNQESLCENPQMEMMRKILDRIEKLEQQSRSSGNQDRNRPRTNIDPKHNIECFNCHDLGHYARECPAPKRPRVQAGEKESKGKPLNGRGPTQAAVGRSN